MSNQGTYAHLLKALLKGIQCDDNVNTQELIALKETLLTNRYVDNQEATLLFDLQGKIGESAKEVFHDLFVDGITSYLLNGHDSPGTLSAQQFVWLQECVSKDHRYSELESDLLKNIVIKAEKLPPNFYEWVRHLEIHLMDFKGDLDELEYEQRTSFMVELKALLAKYFPEKI